MRISVYVTPRTPPPLEMMPALLETFAAWREENRTKMEVFEFFVGGGGLGILNADDEAELHRIMAEFPFSPWSNLDVRPIVDGDVALAQMQARWAAMAASR